MVSGGGLGEENEMFEGFHGWEGVGVYEEGGRSCSSAVRLVEGVSLQYTH